MVVKMDTTEVDGKENFYTSYTDGQLPSTIIKCGFKPKYVCLIHYVAANTYRAHTEIYDESVSTTQTRLIDQSGTRLANKGSSFFKDVTEDGFEVTSVASRTCVNIICIG